MAKASVSSSDALEALDMALARFAEGAAASLESVASAVEHAMDRLEERRRYWAEQVRYWQDAYDAADPEEDDLSALAYRVDEAERQLENVERWQGRVEDCLQGYRGQASRLDELASSRVIEARGFLRKKLELLQDWSGAIHHAGQPSAAQATSAAPASVAGAAAGHAGGFRSAAMPLAPVAPDLTAMPLPAGFCWVKLDDISPAEMAQLPDEGDFRKVEYGEMRRGFEVLEVDILPRLNAAPQDANADYFWQRDRQQGLDESNGAQRVFNAFFGTTNKEHIYLERRKGDRYFSITNGRHRIKVARDLGWQAVPVEAKEVG